MKLKYRLIIDAIMFILIRVCMEYEVTGGFLHELLGIILILAFLVHSMINRKYYSSMLKKLFSGEDVSVKQVVSFIINVLMLLTAVLMLISSVAISNELFAFISDSFGVRSAWVTIHVIASLIMLVCMFVHTILHWKLILSVLSKHIRSSAVVKVIKMGSRVLAVVLAALIVKLSIDNAGDIIISDSGRNKPKYGHYQESEQNKTQPEMNETEEVEKAEDSETVTEQGSDESKPSLQAYLQNLNCDGCHRHCSLASPQCGRGERAANEAEADYYEMYGE